MNEMNAINPLAAMQTGAGEGKKSESNNGGAPNAGFAQLLAGLAAGENAGVMAGANAGEEGRKGKAGLLGDMNGEASGEGDNDAMGLAAAMSVALAADATQNAGLDIEGLGEAGEAKSADGLEAKAKILTQEAANAHADADVAMAAMKAGIGGGKPHEAQAGAQMAHDNGAAHERMAMKGQKAGVGGAMNADALSAEASHMGASRGGANSEAGHEGSRDENAASEHLAHMAKQAGKGQKARGGEGASSSHARDMKGHDGHMAKFINSLEGAGGANGVGGLQHHGPDGLRFVHLGNGHAGNMQAAGGSQAGAMNGAMNGMGQMGDLTPMPRLGVEIAAHARAGHNRFEIRLDPAELGKIDIRLEISRDGQALTHIAVEKPETLDMLRQDARALERALNDAGLDARRGSLSFSLGNGDNSQGRQQMSGERNHDGEKAHSSPAAESETFETETGAPIRSMNFRSGVDISI
jgi:hypothetical protein